MKRKKPYRCVCCRMDVTRRPAKRISRKRAICPSCEKLLTAPKRSIKEPVVVARRAP